MRRQFWATALLWLCAALATACQEPAAPVARRHLRPSARPAQPMPCRGGLLCEDPQTLGGFRVPLGCNRTYDGRYTKICAVSGVRPPQALAEFLTSRYAAAIDRESWLVEQPNVGQLRVFLRGEVAEFVAMPAQNTVATAP